MSGSRPRRRLRIAVAFVLLGLMMPAPAVAAGADDDPGTEAAAGIDRGSDPGTHAPATSYSLIEGALAAHRISTGRATVLLARALYAPRTLPLPFRAPLGRDATLAGMRLVQRTGSLSPQDARLVRHLRSARALDAHWCSSSTTTLPKELQTKHFVIWYGKIGGGLTITDYAAVLEHVWKTEVGAAAFGWARPPSSKKHPAPGGKYPVRIAPAGKNTYGYVSGNGAHAGLVRDNPATAWNEGDARASCMVLNPGFATIGSANNLDDLKVTAAHEFLHAVQFGLGVISADDNYIEGSAAWIEDEVYDSINDNYQYLYPKWGESMGAYPTEKNAAYGYWLVWRGLTESFGSGIAGGAEDVMQRIFENISKGQEILPATKSAFDAFHTDFPFAFHELAIAANYMRSCTGGWVSPLHLCFEEADGYQSYKAPTFPEAGTVTAAKGVSSWVYDDSSMVRVVLPDAPAHYPIAFHNDSASSPMFWSVSCDTGSGVKWDILEPVDPGQRSSLVEVDRTGCVGSSYAIITDSRISAPNPDVSPAATFHVWVPLKPAAGSVSWTVSGTASGNGWTDSWTESGTFTVAIKRDIANLPDYLFADDGSSYTISYSRTRTEYDPAADCTVTYTGSGTGSGSPTNGGWIGDTPNNLDPPNTTDALPDTLGLSAGFPLTYDETYSGCGGSGSSPTQQLTGPFVHGIGSFPACAPSALADPSAVAGFSFGGAWVDPDFRFGCTASALPVGGGTQSITVTGSVHYTA